MTYVNAVKYIKSCENGIPSPERMRLLCRYLGDPQRQMKFVHIAGGSGKSSCASMLSMMLTEAGYRVGSLTSPFIREHREMVSVNKEPLSHADFAKFVEKVALAAKKMKEDIETAALPPEESADVAISDASAKPKITKNLLEGKIDPTPISREIICAAALLAFKHYDCNISILECGESRADPTGIIDPPLVAVICGTSFTEEQLRTGAGIIRRGTREVVTSAPAGEAYSTILDSCVRTGSRLTVPAKGELRPIHSGLSTKTFEYRGKTYSVPYCSEYQLTNALIAIETVYSLRRTGVTLHSEDISRGISKAKIPLRFELLSISPFMIIDCPSGKNDGQAFCDSLSSISASLGRSVTLVTPADFDCVLPEMLEERGFTVLNHLSPKIEADDKRVARIAASMSPEDTLLVLGTPEFCGRLKAHISKMLAYR